MRAIWKGAISFGLVNIPIALYPATRTEDLKFRLLRASDHSPVNYKRVAEADGKEVAWEDIVRRRFLGETVNVTDELDWPRPATGASGWVRTLERLDRGHHALREVVRAFPAARLDDISSDGRRSFYVLIHGVVQHDLYHAGQIAVLRKG